ncbi:MGMT family protein [Actinotalea sp.]|uniref:MGMT family protein n=1 Tax=Actinotalea sp. TaxID=1872145 RepID=UPI00356222EE
MRSSWSAATESSRGDGRDRCTPEDYLEAVLDLVEQIPAGRASTYGTLAEVLRERWGVGGPRQVGTVLARAGGAVPWWRVVNAAGRPPAHHREHALALLRAEGCPLSDDGAAQDPGARVVLSRALWWPPQDDIG